jgi:uncharacterized protein YceH (UPF0502 family)
MLVELSAEQCRVIGVMLEKEVTTPDQYPLSLNGVTLGCNQKSNRDPVVQYSENDVQNIIDELKSKKLIFEQTGVGSRVVKYRHRFCNTEFGDLKLSRQQLAIVCVMLLRGPQTPGELRTRTNRLAEFENTAEVESVLEKMHDLNDEQLVVKLPREPGKRESRYAHLFSGEVDTSALISPSHSAEVGNSGSQNSLARIEQLEDQVAQLIEQVEKMRLVIEELM